jgi:hypothetical protein
MNSILLLAVLSAGQSAGTPSWLDDYGAALSQAKQARKPLLIVIDRPSDAGARIEQISYRDDSRQEALLKNYVLCRVDAGTAYGAEVAKVFGASRLPYTAIIDKTTTAVLYTKAGQFTGDDWTATLVRYQSGERPVAYQPPVAIQQFQPMPSRAFCST